jgi:hypothetical protein
VAILLDAGALVAIDKRDRSLGAMLKLLQRTGSPVRTSAAVVAQVWRGGSREWNLARLLAGVDVFPMGLRDARRAGELQGATRTSDVVDAHFALLAEDEDIVLTSDSKDIGRLLTARGVKAELIEV